MEVALRPRVNAPDVVRSALGQCEKISENSIDKLFAAPSKIVIPERYIPEQVSDKHENVQLKCFSHEISLLGNIIPI